MHDQVDRIPTQVNYIKPLGQKLAELHTPFRKASLPGILHSAGQIQAIIPDLVEMGLAALDPVQWCNGQYFGAGIIER